MSPKGTGVCGLGGNSSEKATTSLTEAAARDEASGPLIAARREHEEMRALKHESMHKAA